MLRPQTISMKSAHAEMVRFHIALVAVLAGLGATLGGAGACRAGGERQVVARIGDQRITRGEFEEQFARQAAPGGDPDSARARFLESMIQKELLVLEAKERGLFAPDPTIDAAVKEFGDDLLRRRMRQEESKADTTVTEAQARQAFELSLDEVRLRHILHWSKAAIDSARQRIDGGEPFGQVAAQASHDRRSAGAGGLLPWLTKLQLIPEFRAAIDAIPVGQVIGPFSSVFGWHVAVVDSLRRREGADFDAERIKFHADVLAERMRSQRNAVQDDYRKGYHLEVDEEAVAAMTAAASSALADTTRRNLTFAEQWVPADSAHVLARYENGQITVGDFRQLLIKEGGMFLQQRLTPGGAIGSVRELFYNDARVLESRRLGYHKDPDWRRQVEAKREELVVERLYGQQVLADFEVSEAEARTYYESHAADFRKPERFRYAFIQVDDAAVAEALVAEMPKLEAAGFDSVVSAIEASGHLVGSKRDSGLREASLCGAVAEAARGLEPGQVGHVIEADGSHTVFSLIQHQLEEPETFELARERVRSTLTRTGMEERLVGFLKELERKFVVKRYPERLALSD